MNPSLRTTIFFWIVGGFVLQKSETHQGALLCEFLFRNICYELVGEPKTWFQARSSCEGQGGELLTVIDNPIRNFLGSITTERNTGNFTWWLGEGAQEENLQPTLENGDDSSDGIRCTYMKPNPLQLITASDCNQTRGFLCTHNMQSPTNTKRTNVSTRATRSLLGLKGGHHVMAPHVSNINDLLLEADKELLRMELEEGEPTDDSRDQFIKYLLEGTEKLSKSALETNDTVSYIINCTTGIFLLSMKKCDIETNPNPTSLFERVFEIFRTVSVLLGLETSQKIVIKHPTGTIYQSSHTPDDLSNAVLGSVEDGEFIKLPPFSALESQLGGYDRIMTQLSTFTGNPHPSDDNISGSVASLLLTNGVSDIKLAHLTEMIEIFLPRREASTRTNTTVILRENTKALTNISVSDPSMTIFFSVEPSENVSLLLTLSQGSPPTSSYFNDSIILSSTGGYRWMITPEMLQQTPGTWYVETTLNTTWEQDLTLIITSFTSKCLYWDEDNERWSPEGCLVGEKSTFEQSHCLCNHLTLFGSSFFVMPNYVDISLTSELFATVSENYVVLALLCAFFGLYLITVLWACYADRRSHSKHQRKMTLLEDNHPGAQYNYLISVQTGHRKNAGTSANVTMKLIGSEGESNTHNLTDPDKPVLERGAVDMFLLATPFSLGEMRHIRLQHDNSGGHPSWYINKVTIQDLQTRHVWHFLCDCWLSADHGDGMTKKTFNAAKSNEIASFRNIFQSRTSTGFRDEHIWVSIVDPPSRSPFTRVQRVSCCMSLLLCTMAINIAFWNIPIDEDSPIIFSFGSFQFTWQDIMVGVQSGLLMFPINILIITIFRSIRPRITSKSQKCFPEEKPLSVTIPTILKETEEAISLVSRSRRNRMAVTYSLESVSDLFPALDGVHELIHLMQGETESDLHWVFCSKFLLAALCHLLMCLEKLDVKNFPSPQDYQQALNITNLMVRKAEMVFSCHLSSCPPPALKKKKRRSASCWLPWWFVFLGWFLLLSISGVSTFFTLLYGFQYGRAKSIKWVMSLGLSLFQSIFILQPLKVIGVAVFFALLLKPVAVEESEEIEQVLLEQQDKCRHYTGRNML